MGATEDGCAGGYILKILSHFAGGPMKKKLITRRQFIQDASLAALGSSLVLGAPGSLWAKSQKKSRVILMRDKDVLDSNGNPREEIILKISDGLNKDCRILQFLHKD